MRVLAALFGATILVTSAQASSLPEFPFVFAEGHAKAEHAPNKAIIYFQVKALGELPSDAVSVVHARSKEILEFFAQQKIKKEDIEAFEIDKDIIRDRENQQELKILGYEVSRRFSVTLYDLQYYEIFAKKLMDMENVEEIETTFDRTDRKKIETQLVLEASRDAKTQAENLAAGFEKQLGDVYAISEHDFEFVSAVFGVGPGYAFFGVSSDLVRMRSDTDEDDLLFVPSTITFESNVYSLFKLKD